MNYEIIIIIGLLIGIFLFKTTQPKFLKAILIGLIVTSTLFFIENKILINISFYGFGILTLLFTIYSGLKRKWLNLTIGFFAFASFVFSAMNFPYANELKLLMIIPILCYILTFIKFKEYKNAVSISTILAAYELTEFLELTTKWLN